MILLSGPCVIENETNLYKIAKELEFANDDPDIEFYFKASFDKANRTSLESFRGPGLEEGLRLLENIKKDFGYKIITDIHESYQAKSLEEVVDIIQIPAFLCRQTDLLVAVANTRSIINIKKGQFMNPADMKYSVLKVLKTRNPAITNSDFAQLFLMQHIVCKCQVVLVVKVVEILDLCHILHVQLEVLV